MAVRSGEALYIRIYQELQAPVSSDSLSCSIFRVPNHLRKINEMAYEPQVISIGPYHRGKDHLKAMEVHKKHYLQMLLDRNKEKTLKEYVETLEGLTEEALKFYSEPPSQRDGEDQFVEMMLFDGCFVVELIRKSAMEELREEKDYLLTHFLLRTVLRDLLLIENQLPFFILMKLFDMTKMSNEADQNFMHMAINCFSRMMPGPCSKKIENHPRIKHLLGLLHGSCVSPPESPKGVNPPPPEAARGVRPPPPKGVSPPPPEAARGVRPPPPEAAKGVKPTPPEVPKGVKPPPPEAPKGVRPPPPEAPKGVRPPPPEAPKGVKPPQPEAARGVRPPPPEAARGVRPPPPEAAKGVKPPPPEVPKGVRPPPPEATCSPRSASSSTTKPSGIVKCSTDVVRFPPEQPCSLSPVRFPPRAVPCSLSPVRFPPRYEPCSSWPVRFPPPKTTSKEGKSLPPLETEAESRKSSKGAMEDNHHRQCPMKLNDALFSALKKLKEAILRMVKPKGHEEKKCNWQTIGSASELHEAGIKFEKIEDRLFDINFEKGVMSIPTLKIVDDTESILRNLVAYEQCYKDISSRHFTAYIRFMDCLINTGKDVELLRRHEVIENRLGDNEVIAGIFNRICDAVLIAEEDFFYSEMFNKVNKHCRKRRNQWMANFRHNYVNTPWALISVIAAVILLLLTVQQSVYSILAYHFHH